MSEPRQAPIETEQTERDPAREIKPVDAVTGSWVDRAPRRARPFLRLMRMDRPIGSWLLFWPCVFGIILGAVSDGRMFPDPVHILLMGIGSVVMRGAGCTYNDIIDRDIDAQVGRTRGRPIPSGAVSVRAAWILAIALSLIGFVVLVAFNVLTIVLGISSLALVAIYPFMKRITWWPQAWLGLTFNWGAILGFTAEAGELAPPAFILYAGCFFWTLGYDTIYAHQDKEYDAFIGIGSSARRLNILTKPWLYGFYSATFFLILASGLLVGLGIAFAITLLVTGIHMIWQLHALDIERPLICLRLFRSTRDTGALITMAMLLGAVATV
jgi:4-hydroxybenzoate polyprenyltransferase